jgi:S-adenosylmethionine uptake transporter
MLFASLMFAIMALFVKFASDEASLSQVILFRGVPTAIGVLIWALATRKLIIPTTWRLHVMRNIAGVGSIWLGFFAMAHLPLATAITLNYTSPLFIAGWMMMQGGIRHDRLRLFAVALGFVGVVAILRPDVDNAQWLASLLALVAGGLTALAVMQVRSLGQAGEPEWRIVLFFSLTSCVTGGAATLVTGWIQPSLNGWMMLFGVGLSGLLGQFAMTRAFSRGSAALSAVLQFSTIPFSVLLGFLFWNDHPDGFAWLGIVLIAAAGLLSTWRTMTVPPTEK